MVRLNKKTRSNYMLLKGTDFKHKDINRLKIKEWQIIYHANTIKGKLKQLHFFSNKGLFRIKNTIKDKESYLIMINRLIHEKDITTLHSYACKNK